MLCLLQDSCRFCQVISSEVYRVGVSSLDDTGRNSFKTKMFQFLLILSLQSLHYGLYLSLSKLNHSIFIAGQERRPSRSKEAH